MESIHSTGTLHTFDRQIQTDEENRHVHNKSGQLRRLPFQNITNTEREQQHVKNVKMSHSQKRSFAYVGVDENQRVKSQKSWAVQPLERPAEQRRRRRSSDRMSIEQDWDFEYDDTDEEVDFEEETSLCSLDCELADDIWYPSEYAEGIFEHYKSIEKDHMVRPYLDDQPSLTTDMRRVLVDWMLELHMNFKLKPQTIFLAVNILDRFLSVQKVRKAKLQLVGCGALLVASKYEDIYAPEIQDFVYITRNAYSKDDIIAVESAILNALGFRLSFPTTFHFVQRYLQVALLRIDWELDEEESKAELKFEAFYFMQLSALNYNCLTYPPSKVAASITMVSLCRLEREWISDLEKYTGYSKEDLKECAFDIFQEYKRDKQCRNGTLDEKVSAPTRYYYKKKSLVQSQAMQLVG